MANDTVFIYDERGPRAVSTFFIEDAVSFHHLALEIAEQRKCYPNILSEALVSREAINADSQDLCAGGFEFGDISLIRL